MSFCRTLARPRRARLRRQRGAVYVEAVILVFFMIIIFASIQYLARYFRSKHQAQLLSRRCAWLFSKSACMVNNPEYPPLPAVCQSVVGAGNISKTPNPALAQGANPQAANSQQSTAMGQQLQGGVNETLNPMVALVVGESLTARAARDIQRGNMFKNAAAEARASYYLPCNLKNQTPMGVVRKLWDDMGLKLP